MTFSPTKGRSGDDPSLAVVFLAAGYGTRIASDMRDDPQFCHLATTPKPLLPLGGLPLISHWMPLLAELGNVTSVVVITNTIYYLQYREWVKELPSQLPHVDNLPPILVLSDGTTDNSTRYGGVHDMHIALSHISRTAPQTRDAVVIAADTLLPNVKLSELTRNFLAAQFSLGVVGYRLTEMADCVRRGMLVVDKTDDGTMIATSLVEKPTSVDLAPSSWATAPVYFLKRSLWPRLSTFLEARTADPVEARDAPGLFLAWLLKNERCLVLPISDRIDIGRLQHYREALFRYTQPPLPPPLPRISTEPAIGRAFPRIGLLGNPSDMYGGRVISVAIQSEGFAEVVATPSESFSIVSNPELELPSSFSGISAFVEALQSHGVCFGAYRLVLAATLAFAKKFAAAYPGKDTHEALARLPSCHLSYSTSIPALIGLAGSSALILATFRALARFFNSSLERIDPDRTAWPVLLRSVEADNLRIACGLQDRVAQVMHGCVDMDFSSGMPGVWAHIPHESLPQLYLVYHRNGVGECSGVVHSRAKKNIEVSDSTTKEIITNLANGAHKIANALRAKQLSENTDLSHLPSLFDRNFELRCELFGKSAISSANIKLIDAAHEAGFASKMSGSGGCAVCIPQPLRTLSDEEEASATAFFTKHDMIFRKVKILEPLEWRN